MREEITHHFDGIAQSYEKYKESNWYYYSTLKKLIKIMLPNTHAQTVVEIGCGIGDLLAFLKPKKGIGIDVSKEMIALAKSKYPYQFIISPAESFKAPKADAIIMVDVIEHLSDIAKTLTSIRKSCKKDARVLITMANPLWEPILLLLEKLKLKMPEGEHYRIPYKKLKRLLKKFEIVEHGHTLHLPVHIPGISPAVNNTLQRIPLIKRLGLIEYILLKPK